MLNILNQVNGNAILGMVIVIYCFVWSSKTVPKFKRNEYLPIASILLGLVFGAFIGCFTDVGCINGLIDGAIDGALSSGGHELFDSFKKFLQGVN